MTTTPDGPTEDQATSKHDDQQTGPAPIDDSQLPEDLRPTDDNPLAQNEDE